MLKLRFVTLIAVAFSFLASLLMFVVGAVKTLKAFRVYLLNEPLTPDVPAYLDTADQTMITLIESIDAFLVALVFFVLSTGIYRLFIRELAAEKKWVWDEIRTFEQLKKTLVEMIMVVLVVYFLGVALYEGENLQWTVLILPASVLLLALSIRLVGWSSKAK